MNRVMNLSVRMVVVLMMVAWLIQSAGATTIEYLGTDTTTGAGWRATNVNTAYKLAHPEFDPSGDKAYGNDGYYCGYGSTWSGGTGLNVMSSPLPSYIQGVTETGDSGYYTYHYGAFALVDNPSQPIGPNGTLDRVPGIWVTSVSAPQYAPIFTITLKEKATFVLTTIVDQLNFGAGTPEAVKITAGAVSADNTISGITTDMSPDYVFFKLSGNAGDTFTVSLGSGNATSGIAFEATSAPEPSTTVMLVSGIAGLLAYAWRKRR